jgi:hypothetical protein
VLILQSSKSTRSRLGDVMLAAVRVNRSTGNQGLSVCSAPPSLESFGDMAEDGDVCDHRQFANFPIFFLLLHTQKHQGCGLTFSSDELHRGLGYAILDSANGGTSGCHASTIPSQ